MKKGVKKKILWMLRNLTTGQYQCFHNAVKILMKLTKNPVIVIYSPPLHLPSVGLRLHFHGPLSTGLSANVITKCETLALMFPVNFVKFWRKPFVFEHLWWLLLFLYIFGTESRLINLNLKNKWATQTLFERTEH